MTTAVNFLMPTALMLASYADALRTGWSPSNVRDVSGEQLTALADDAAAFLATLADGQPPRTRVLDDGRVVPLLPMRTRWIWDGMFCGVINLRWQPGTEALPPYVSGHSGYAVVPWQRGRGLATKALRHILSEARDVGLRHIDITTDADNVASQKVVLFNGGRLIEAFVTMELGPEPRHLYRIML